VYLQKYVIVLLYYYELSKNLEYDNL